MLVTPISMIKCTTHFGVQIWQHLFLSPFTIITFRQPLFSEFPNFCNNILIGGVPPQAKSPSAAMSTLSFCAISTTRNDFWGFYQNFYFYYCYYYWSIIFEISGDEFWISNEWNSDNCEENLDHLSARFIRIICNYYTKIELILEELCLSFHFSFLHTCYGILLKYYRKFPKV